jgi:hypothetical protein
LWYLFAGKEGLPTSNLFQDIDYFEDYLGSLEFFKENPQVVDCV